MAFPAMWIRQNMFQKSDENVLKEQIVYGRTLTEAEIRVRKSLEKLSIPDWYLNNSSRPPKILMHDTPIESRPSSWKTESYQKRSSHSTPSLSKSLSVVPKSDGQSNAPKLSPKQRKQNENVVFKRWSPDKVGPWQKKIPGVKKSNISGTYPKISPSRKIRNINIVFPQPSVKLDLDIDDLKPLKNSVESLEATEESDSSVSSLSDVETIQTVLNDSVPECVEKSSMPSPSRYATYTKKSSPKQSNVSFKTTDLESSTLKKIDFGIPSTSKKSPVCTFPTPSPKTALLKSSRASSSELTRVANRNEKAQICENCRANVIKVPYEKPPVPSREFYPRRFSKPIDDVSSTNKLSRQPSDASSSNMTFILSPNKSTTLEKIVQNKSTKLETSLVQDIIAELEGKCKDSCQPTYSTIGSRNFVRELVKALETDENDEEIHKNTEKTPLIKPKKYVEEYVGMNNYNGRDITSAADSKLFKDGGRVTVNEVRSDKKNLKPGNEIEVKNDDVIWIPAGRTNFPRTSSLLSFSSRDTTTNSVGTSPCVSPIGVDNGLKLFQTDNNVNMFHNYRRSNPSTKKLFRIDESTVILDSGYSEKSKPLSLADGPCSNFEEPQTPSVTDSVSMCSANSLIFNFRYSAIMGKSIIV